MPQATFWLASPFSQWIGQRTVVITWDGALTLRQALERLAAEYPTFRAKLTPGGLRQEGFNLNAAVIVDGNLLPLDAPIPDGAAVDLLLPLTGGGHFQVTVTATRLADRRQRTGRGGPD